jgi:hypothetical protein
VTTQAGTRHSRRARLLPLVSFAACEIARRAYRWRRSHVGLGARLARLRSELGPLPRGGIGLRLADIDPGLDSRLRTQREAGREIILADFDQDGGLVSRFGPIAGIATIRPEQFLRRSGCAVSLVDLDGRIGVRKEFVRATGRFVQELEALVRLEQSRCPVPRIINVDWNARSVTMTFIRGHVVRELLAAAGAPIRDRDDPRPYSRSVDRERILAGRALLRKVMSAAQIEAVGAALGSIHRAGFVLEDVKFGNIIIEHGSGAPMFVDLERAIPVAQLPRAVANHLRGIDLAKFHDHFGDGEE